MTEMTESLAASNPSLESSKARRVNWIPYLLIGLVANAAIWSLALAYLRFASPIYTSKWILTLPGTGTFTDINLPDIGRASAGVQSAYKDPNGDPRENYKVIAESEAVRSAAAKELNMTVSEFGKPRIKVIVNTTLMDMEFAGDNPELAHDKSWALYRAFQARLTELRLEDVAQRNASTQSALVASQQKLELAQRRLSEYKARSGLVSDNQISQLSDSIESLRRQKAEILARQQEANARLGGLSTNLNVSAQQAADAFSLKVDQVFQGHRTEYSQATSALAGLTSRYGANHPAVVRERGRQQAALAALQARSQEVLGQPAQEATLAQLNLGDMNTGGGASREGLFRDLVTVQTEQQGYEASAQELDRQIAQLEQRLKTLAQYSSTLDALRRDLQVAETVFSSTLASLDLGKSTEMFGTYPRVQLLTEPDLPKKPSSPNKQFTLLGAAAGSFALSMGLLLFWMRQSWMRQRKAFKSEQTQLTSSGGRLIHSEPRSQVLDLSNNK